MRDPENIIQRKINTSARFDNPPMENISTGFYMVDYAEDQQFR